MSTPFDVRRWAEQAGIHTTGGFSVVAECVTLDELQRFADIAIATAAKHWQRAHAITALEALENAQDQLAKPYSTEASKAITALRAALAEPNKCTHGVTDGNCKECYMAELEQEPVFDCPRCGHCCPQTEQEPFAYCYVRKGISVDILTFDDNPKDAVSGTVFPLYTAPPQRKPLTDEEIGKAWSVADGEHNASAAVKRRITRAIEAAHNIKGEA